MLVTIIYSLLCILKSLANTNTPTTLHIPRTISSHYHSTIYNMSSKKKPTNAAINGSDSKRLFQAMSAILKLPVSKDVFFLRSLWDGKFEILNVSKIKTAEQLGTQDCRRLVARFSAADAQLSFSARSVLFFRSVGKLTSRS